MTDLERRLRALESSCTDVGADLPIVCIAANGETDDEAEGRTKREHLGRRIILLTRYADESV